MRRCKNGRWLRHVITVVAVVLYMTDTPSVYATDPPTPRADREATPHNPTSQDIRAPDVYAYTLLVRDELELIRLEMGKPKETRREVGVIDAAPREVFFQALTLFQKANRLSFELTRERTVLPERPVGTIRPAHVLAVVNGALEGLLRVKVSLGILEQSQQRPPDPTKTPTDVFRSIVQANRQLNRLLDQPFAPSDVFQQVTVAVGYASQLLAHFPDTRMPEAPAFERRKSPADVYHRLVGCFTLIRKIMERSGLKALTLTTHPEEVTPSDVYDIASLSVSELTLLHAHLDGTLPPPVPYYPGRKFPADVYQRAGLLETILTTLQELVDTHPTWLQATDRR